MVETRNVGPHPRVYVASHRDLYLRLVEGLGGLHALPGLADVELLVDGRVRMDVVERVVAVADLEGLSDLHRDDVRVVHAALLVEQHRLRGSGIAARDAALDVDQDVLQAAAARVDGLALQALRVHRLALRIRGGLDLLRGRGSALEADLPRDGGGPGGGAAGARSGRRGRGRGRSGRRYRLFLGSAAAGEEGQADEGEHGKRRSNGHRVIATR